MAESAAEVVPVHAIIISELDRRLLRLRAIADEREREFSIRVIGPAQQAHAQYLSIKADGAFQVADPQHGVQHAHA